MMTVQYIAHSQIDKQRWDEALNRFCNATVYAQSAFLDAMSPGWDALITSDYEAIFPLPWRRKAGIYYLYQPFLAAQLGLFSNLPSEAQLNSFLSAIPAKFKLFELSLNASNRFANTVFPLYERTNFVLDLSPSYEQLQASYRENIRRNRRKAIQSGCVVDRNTQYTEIAVLAAAQASDQQGLEAFGRLVLLWQTQGKALNYGIRSASGQLLASAVFLLDNRRAYYLLIGNHPNGRTIGASHLLIDSFIQDHAGQALLLDFEGSDFHNLAFFYSSFGAKQEPYAALRVNRLPWWMRWLKGPGSGPQSPGGGT